MAPSRGKGKAAANATTSTARRSTRSRAPDGNIPDVYQAMLQEADVADTDTEIRPPKRRRVVTPESVKKNLSRPVRQVESETQSSKKPASQLQTVEDSSDSENSDFEFEDVDLSHPVQPTSDDADDGIEDLSISVQAESSIKRSGQPRRKPATFAEKAHRLLVHKLHVLCLLGHSMYVNGWCSNTVVQRHLRPLLSSKTVSYLNPKVDDSQFQRNRSFQDGLEQAVSAFSAHYRVSARGLSRPHWDVEDSPSTAREYADPMDRSDFIAAAKDMEGSQDVGNQLFCALLRSVGVQTRLICSLQPLPFGSVPKAGTPKKPVKQKIMAIASDKAPSAGLSDEDTALIGSTALGKVPSVRRRLGQPSFADAAPQAPPPKKSKPVPKLTFPIYWVEAFNTAHQKWIAVDPIVTHTVNKPAKLEPPSTYDLNQLTYAIAFEENGAARDVTKRYAKAFNAKTRRYRVESSNDGAKWLKKAMRIFRRPSGLLDRDQVEDAELAQKEAREGMPANVLDFKDHPFYALERHLKRHEVIHPLRAVGKVNAGTAAKPRMEDVYRRQDLLSCKSADKWYRCGREIKAGEQPLKHISRRTRRQRSIDDEDPDGAGDVSTTGLYAPHQTQLYVPPPVERGRVPRNAFGNLDIYVPSMVPAGGTHIRHRLTKDAARLLRVDYAEAVTGFSFKGRHGTAVVEGAIVPSQFADAVSAVIDGFENQVVEDESRARSLEALRLWKKFLVGMKIVERVSGYAGTNDTMDVDKLSRDEHGAEPGGFFPGAVGEEESAMPTAGRFSIGELRKASRKPKRKPIDDDSEDDSGLVDDEGAQDGGFLPEDGSDSGMAGGFMAADDEVDADNDLDGAGGFLLETNDGEGGFLPNTMDDGGGFMVEGDDGDDGGFPPGDYDTSNAKAAETLVESRLATAESTSNSAASIASNSPVMNDSKDSIDSKNQDVAVDIDMIDRAQLSGIQSGPSNLYGESSLKSVAEDAADDDRQSDKGSLLSHDPEDEDAEPDWLESD